MNIEKNDAKECLDEDVHEMEVNAKVVLWSFDIF